MSRSTIQRALAYLRQFICLHGAWIETGDTLSLKDDVTVWKCGFCPHRREFPHHQPPNGRWIPPRPYE